MIAHVVLLALGLGASPATAMQLDPGARQTVRYHVSATFHKVTGTSQRLQGRARVLPGGEVQAEVKVPVTSFTSGNANRDSNAMEAVEAQRFPDVVVRAVAHGTNGQENIRVQVTFHGITREEPGTISIERSSTDARTTGHFTLELSDFRVERPRLLFVPIDDSVPIDFDLAWKAVPPA